jgi:proteasome lid subunit RPN8/RPN11
MGLISSIKKKFKNQPPSRETRAEAANPNPQPPSEDHSPGSESDAASDSHEFDQVDSPATGVAPDSAAEPESLASESNAVQPAAATGDESDQTPAMPDADAAVEAVAETSSQSRQEEHAETLDHGETATVTAGESLDHVEIEKPLTSSEPRVRLLGPNFPDDSTDVPASDTQSARTGEPSQTAPAARIVVARARLFECQNERRRPDDCEVVILQSVYRYINAHLREDTSREHGGLLMGYEEYYPDRDGSIAVVIAVALRAEHTKGDLVRLTFTEETQADLIRRSDQINQQYPNLRRVGWYHSHPGHGVFLSRYDLNVCLDFTKPTQVALVVDPIRNQGGFFVHGSDGYRSDAPQGFWERHDLQKESIVRWKNVRAKGISSDPETVNPDEAVRSPYSEYEADQPEVNYEPSTTSVGDSPADAIQPNVERGAAGLIDASPDPYEDVSFPSMEHVPISRGTQTNVRYSVPPWVFLLFGVVLPTVLVIFGIRFAIRIDRQLERIERSFAASAASTPAPSAQVSPAAGTIGVVQTEVSPGSPESGSDDPAHKNTLAPAPNASGTPSTIKVAPERNSRPSTQPPRGTQPPARDKSPQANATQSPPTRAPKL